MNELISVVGRAIGAEQVQTVNARDLHAFLEVGKVFAAWIQERISQYGFVAGVDFEVFSDSGNNPTGGRPAREYVITLDMAKELAMVERNEKGKQARQYFIQCERRAKQMARPAIPQTLPEALRLAADEAEKRAAAEAQLAIAAPKVAALDRIAGADGMLNLTGAAKALQQQPIKFCESLRQLGWIYRRAGGKSNVAYQDKIQAGYLTHKTTTVLRGDGTEKICEQVLVTPKGLTKLAVLMGGQAG
ncbi:antA/AntB antirepressor family protein [Cupriavidus sp. CV2]|uniref:phage antirepressor KilAC domain-containing protein n=1 Tax=Cupriavidus ulmosensis TaxID=3065913 RepID=UPI00296AD3CD|nr:phage antirepressor KilAC domain-containing protein [Cupriavidus sp. CV2]MDW3682952.1 antA/AntB antirepressor family protein [Cupriavidus sp. CV2]